MITEPVVRLRRELGFPGMVVLQFAFGGDPTNPHLPQNHDEHSVVYTGTHDNDTTRGWWESLTAPSERAIGARSRRPALVADRGRVELARRARDRPAAGRARSRLRGAHEPPRHREGNWQWRFEPRADAGAARRLRDLTERSGGPMSECRGRESNPHVPKGQPVLSRSRLTSSATPAGSGSAYAPHWPGWSALFGKTPDSGAW